MPPDDRAEAISRLQIRTFDDALGHRIIGTHMWAVREGLRGAGAYELFDGFCQRLVIDGIELWRAHLAMETLHPQWSGYGYTWRRDLNAIEPEQYVHGSTEDADFLGSPFNELIVRAQAGEENPSMRRRVEEDDQRDFPVLAEFFPAGATDYLAYLFTFGKGGDRSQGTGIVYSFVTDRRGGFSDDETTLLQATLPGLSLAMKAHAGYVIASGLLGTYLGEDAGRRVHAGSIMRGSVDTLRAVIWYADIRGFTTVSDSAPGPVVVELLNEVFEILTASLRVHGGQVLKFIGDGMLAIFSFEEHDRAETCRHALDAAIEAMRNIDEMNKARAAAGIPVASVDLALHLGEVLYGNVGATDRLDFTVIGPAVNEVARIEALCEPLGRPVLVSAEFVAGVMGADDRLESLGRHALRGIREPKEIFALDLGGGG
ncbi:MAG: adenylate/guanylate cyclase domain-containing protein [Roseiarcus sp.]|uniref:adenylate/guanylate cyclase domain-containing protein n=1 Tax=Roseiarcus sp. TaxID=1969460 RepID=UPI003C4D3317